MTTTLINSYQIEFNNITSKNSITGKSYIRKIPRIGNNVLFDLLYSWRDAAYIDESLLFDINTAISNNIEVETDSERYAILVFRTHTDFYDDNGLFCSFPTQDIKEIVIGWRDFLLSTPLDGTIL